VTALVLAALRLHVPDLDVHVHFHRFHGPPFDYGGLALAAALSWIIGIGPGEVLLIAAAVLAAKHKLDLTEVVLIAWLGAMLGGIIGWLVGVQAGQAVLTARGPFRRSRQNALTRGERVFKRRVVLAVVLTPSWVAGILRVRWRVFLPANALSAAIWAIGIGVGGFLIGPPIADLFGELGTAGLIILSIMIAAGGLAEIARRRVRPR
jgi:membrane protein DedA with SNARE-associated domain